MASTSARSNTEAVNDYIMNLRRSALDDSITKQRQIVKIATEMDQPGRAQKLNELALSLAKRFDLFHAEEDITEALEVGTRAVKIARATEDPNLGACLENLKSYAARGRSVTQSKGNRSPAPAPKAISTASLTTLFYFMVILDIMKNGFEMDPDVVGLDQVIINRRAEVKCTPEDDINYAINLYNFGNYLKSRFEKQGGVEDLKEAISSYRLAVQSSSEAYKKFHLFLNNLGISLIERFELLGDITDLNEGLPLQLHALRLADKDEAMVEKISGNIGNSYLSRFAWIGKKEDLQQAVSYQRRAIHITPVGDPRRPPNLHNLGLALVKSFDCFGDVKYLEEAIVTHRSAVEAAPTVPRYLDSLGAALFIRFEKFGEMRDLDDAISRNYQAIASAYAGHPKLHIYLNNLGLYLMRRFDCVGELKDLDEAISHLRHAVQLAPPGHQNLAGYLSNLGSSLFTIHKRLGFLAEVGGLEEGISCLRAAVLLMPPDYPTIHQILDAVGAALTSRYDHYHDLEDLENAVSVERQAIEHARRRNHPDLPALISQLGSTLSRRYDRLGEAKDIEEAIAVQREAICSIPKSDRNYSGFLFNLAILLERGLLSSGMEDILDEFISFEQPRSNRNLNSLWNTMLTRGQPTAASADIIDEIISCFQECITLTPQGRRAEHANYQSHLGYALMIRFWLHQNKVDFQRSISAMRKLKEVPHVAPFSALLCAMAWANNARLANELATAMEGYETYLSIVPQIAWIGQSATSRQKIIQFWRLPTMATDAASCAIELGNLEHAVEILDEGRSVFWGQALGFRTDLAALREADPTLAAQLDAAARELEPSSIDDPSVQGIPVAVPLEREESMARRHRVAEQWSHAFEGFPVSKTSFVPLLSLSFVAPPRMAP
jgi:tetratricopeptide (TPR) repeat protein